MPNYPDFPTDSELVKRLIGGIKSRGRGRNKQPRWSHAMSLFGLGSTYAAELCHRHGFDPNEEV